MATEPPGNAVLPRAVVVRSALLSAAVAAALVPAFATPAHAAEPADLRVSVSPAEVALVPGDAERVVTITVTNRGPGEAIRPELTVSVPLRSAGVTVARSSSVCTPTPDGTALRCALESLPPEASTHVSVTLAPPERTPNPGLLTERVEVAARDLGAATGTPPVSHGASLTATVGGNRSDESVDRVAGTVRDGASGQPVAGVRVTIRDADGNERATDTDDAGTFRYDADDGEPLRPGRLEIQVAKRGYAPAATVVRADPGQQLDDVRLAVSRDDLTAVANGRPSADRPASDQGEPYGGRGTLLATLLLATVLASGALLTWRGRVRRSRKAAADPSEVGDDAGLDLVSSHRGSGG